MSKDPNFSGPPGPQPFFIMGKASKSFNTPPLKWDKESSRWIINPSKIIQNRKEFYRCPQCDSHNLVFYYDKNLNTDSIITKDWNCNDCGCRIDFEDLSKITRDFINNIFLKELNLIYKNPVKMKVRKPIFNKMAGGINLAGNLTGINVKAELNDNLIYKCGSCNKKGPFKIDDEDKTLFQCLKCGHINYHE